MSFAWNMKDLFWNVYIEKCLLNKKVFSYNLLKRFALVVWLRILLLNSDLACCASQLLVIVWGKVWVVEVFVPKC